MVEKYIKHLLFEHDCVVIPDFGGFIANYVGAEIHPIHHTFQPPSKNIAFNEMLKLNDGLLISYISTHENISREEAHKAVKEYAESVKNEIRSKDKYKFEEIGTLYLNYEQKLQFEPESKINYLSSSYSLPQLEYKPIERVSSYSKFKSKDRASIGNEGIYGDNEDEFELTIEKRRSRSKIVLAIVIPILLFLAGSAGYFLFVDNGKTALSSFDPFVSFKRNEIESDTTTIIDDSFLHPDTTGLLANENITSDSLNAVEENWTEVESNEPPTATLQPEPATQEVATLETETKEVIEKEPEATPAPIAESAPKVREGVAVASAIPRYYVIIGGFSVEKNAFKLKNKLFAKGHTEAKVIIPEEAGKLLKVSYADFESFDSAASKAQELKGEYGNSVWVFKY